MIRELSVNENMIVDFLTLSGGKADYKKLAEYVYKGYEIPKNPEIVMNSAVKRIIAKIKKHSLDIELKITKQRVGKVYINIVELKRK